jgi:addiction module HigA family antidote
MMGLTQKPIHPGEVLDEVYIKPVQPPITIHDLADSINVSSKELANFIGGKRPVTLPLAARLAMRFRTTTGYWLGLQDLYNQQSQTSTSLRAHRQSKIPRR